MQTCIYYAWRTACAGAVAQRPRAGVQHACLRTHCTLKYHPDTQQHTNKAYPRTHYASSNETWLERSPDLAAYSNRPCGVRKAVLL